MFAHDHFHSGTESAALVSCAAVNTDDRAVLISAAVYLGTT